MTLAPVKEEMTTVENMKSLLQYCDLELFENEDIRKEFTSLFEDGRFRDKYLLWAVHDGYEFDEIFSPDFPKETIEKGLEEAETRPSNLGRCAEAGLLLENISDEYPEDTTAYMYAMMSYLRWWADDCPRATIYAVKALAKDNENSLGTLMFRALAQGVRSPAKADS